MRAVGAPRHLMSYKVDKQSFDSDLLHDLELRLAEV